MKTKKFIVGAVLFLAGILAGSGEMPDASFAAFLLEKLASLGAIIIGALIMARNSNNNNNQQNNF